MKTSMNDIRIPVRTFGLRGCQTVIPSVQGTRYRRAGWPWPFIRYIPKYVNRRPEKILSGFGRGDWSENLREETESRIKEKKNDRFQYFCSSTTILILILLLLFTMCFKTAVYTSWTLFRHFWVSLPVIVLEQLTSFTQRHRCWKKQVK